MINLEYLQTVSLEAFAECLDKNRMLEGSPLDSWFSKTYCDKCESIKCKYTDAKEKLGISPLSYSGEVDCAYCELNDHCKFFPQIKGIPDNKEVIKMWLNEGADYDGKTAIGVRS